jgi:1-acyl-sn-glycerol-3-phosphate acyltransferase
VTDVLLTMWRSCVIFVWHVLIAIPSLVLVAVHRDGGSIGQALFARFWGRVTLRMCGVPWTATGFEKLDHTGPWVLVANHSSEFDFYALAARLRLQWRALMKPGLRKIPGYGWVAEKSGMVFVRLGDPDTRSRAYRLALEQLARGHSLLVFAEGRRSFDAKIRPLKRGAFVLAIEAQVPIVPIAVEERLARPATMVLGRALAHRITDLRIVAGDPIPTTGLTLADLDALRDRTTEAIAAAHLTRPQILSR